MNSFEVLCLTFRRSAGTFSGSPGHALRHYDIYTNGLVLEMLSNRAPTVEYVSESAMPPVMHATA
jgi:hypothetical protein